MYISVFYVFYHPFSIKKIGKYDDLDVEIFFSPLNQVRFTRIWQKKKKLYSSQLELKTNSSPILLDLVTLLNSSWKFFFLFLIFWVLSKNKKTHKDFSSSKKIVIFDIGQVFAFFDLWIPVKTKRSMIFF